MDRVKFAQKEVVHTRGLLKESSRFHGHSEIVSHFILVKNILVGLNEFLVKSLYTLVDESKL